MSRFQKAVDRLLSAPRDFTWQELQTVLGKLGYKEYAGSGSQRKFIRAKTKQIISLHKPHPSTILKGYAVNYIIQELKEQGLI